MKRSYKIICIAGSSVLVRPITESRASTVSVYLPGGSSEIWYDIDNYRGYAGNGYINLHVSLDKVSAPWL